MNFPEQRAALADIVAIPVTPYLDGAVDLPIYAALLRRLVDNGVSTITPNGNTSEFTPCPRPSAANSSSPRPMRPGTTPSFFSALATMWPLRSTTCASANRRTSEW